MLDTLAEAPEVAIIPPREAYMPFTHAGAEKIIPAEDSRGSLQHGLETLVSAYETARVAHGVTYEDGISGLIADLAGDIRGSQDAQKVLAVAQKYLSRDELRAVVQFFQRTNTFWNDLLARAELERSLYTGKLKENSERKLQLGSFQQKLAHLLYEMGHYHPDSVERRVFELAMKLIDEFAGREDSGLFAEIQGILDGAGAQAALMRGFQDSDYVVIIPDPDDRIEMGATDLKGVDFMVIDQNGKIICVDAKGNRSRQCDYPTVTDRSVPAMTRDHMFKYLSGNNPRDDDSYPGIATARRQYARSLDMSHVVVTLPTRKQFLSTGQINPNYRGPFMHSIISEAEHIGEYETVA
ncbi:hypothetical protein A3H80_02375 [Candidatus Roizmanbacteria bacterium RIFCSPLOWO2_02_FULL_37_19]|uniref:Uncharacterized protein n=1 Tax=Candidatus Roizmanbacteria bacterium RIFCSPHIGHO2_02_FULL_37_24 TaxID=1802037 RepID=A0A1F7H0R9_9BACT|nr:MAG: hypothetical protein A2862_02995 [Candidatus Roizmanbacteria bacterium RIFCSPHIGHO2_01_FULL_38_41]OGK24715.1 MAG: hypothetical protein A3C24_01165 [Candidatus Roizmanbacteria bacterium RIFCSPHIGHO2_02_FULL_37_24]OGK32891.1 MAG: hypothetical protein A3E10_02910 [Candidatus Roizmanbacteria bacterium RIFCSPHIGHO2_12_FULL_37_23]OGK44106.1 MAG: hypothetical protein A2956_03590 [Candidatus Roizmanbacteria bacterium RIFCSPLOWO2_01_FULL_37_57]OGK54387.1 MAG: hypothetical protein A3H80_02375 [Ca